MKTINQERETRDVQKYRAAARRTLESSGKAYSFNKYRAAAWRTLTQSSGKAYSIVNKPQLNGVARFFFNVLLCVPRL